MMILDLMGEGGKPEWTKKTFPVAFVGAFRGYRGVRSFREYFKLYESVYLETKTYQEQMKN